MRAVVTRPHWSYSSISQYVRCPLQYYFERIQKIPRKSASAAQVLGSALHSAVAQYHQTIQSGDPVQPQQIQAAYLAAWDEQETRGPVVNSGDKSREDTRSLGLALVEVYLKEPPPTNIVAVEKPMLAPIANSRGDYLEKPILVVADLITRQDDNSLQVGELKTSGRSYSESEVATSLQPTFYTNALYELTGEEPSVEFTVLVKNKTPKVQRIQAIRTSTDYRRLGDLIGAVETGIEAGIFYPVESPLNCSGCAYYRPCREWSGNQGQEVDIHPGVKEVVGC